MVETWLNENAGDAQVVIFFSLFAFLSLLEILVARRTTPSDRKSRWPANIVLTVLNIAALSMLPVTFLAAAQWAASEGVGLLNIDGIPEVVSVVGTLLLRGFISFFTHYLNHKIPLFWRVHRVHHLDTELDVSTTVRFHPFEFFIGLIPGVPLVVAFGLSPWVLLLYELLDVSVTLFSHSNVRIPASVERVLRYVVVTPDLHRVHHSSRQPETDSNFSAVFPIWDVLFGTFRTETREPPETMELGLEEVRDGRTNSVLWLLTSPFVGRLTEDAETEPEMSAAE